MIDAKWIVTLSGFIGVVFIFAAQEGNIFTLFAGIVLVILFCVYFLVLEKQSTFNYLKRLPIESIRYKIVSTLKTIFNIQALTVTEPHVNMQDNKSGLIKTWTKKRRIINPILLSLILMLSLSLLLYKIDTQDFRGDEHLAISAAQGYAEYGNFYRWEWIEEKPVCTEDTWDCIYDRAWIHSKLVATSYKIFGVSEWSARIVSAAFILLLSGFTYFFVSFFTKRRTLGLISALSIAIAPAYVGLGQYVRMYALLAPLFLILVFLLYRGITGKSIFHPEKSILHRFIYKNLNFNYAYLFVVALLLYPIYIIHINSLVLFPAAFLFLVYMALYTKERKYILAASAGVIGVIAATLVGIFTTKLDKVTTFLSFFGRENDAYLSHLLAFPFPEIVGVVFILLGFISLFVIKDIEIKHRLTYLYIIVSFSLVFFVYIADRYASFVYISHIVPIALFLIIFGYFQTIASLRHTLPKIILAAIFFGTLAHASYIGLTTDIYATENDAKFREAYKPMLENFVTGEHVVFGQYLRKYYLQNLDKNADIVSMLNKKQYEYDTFLSDLETYDSGWLTWEKKKRYHIQKEILKYAENNFQKIGGDGIDNTRIEVYYFDKSMIPSSTKATTTAAST